MPMPMPMHQAGQARSVPTGFTAGWLLLQPVTDGNMTLHACPALAVVSSKHS
jgi:hypothetical protein